jgi:hypothetical protein
MNVLGIGGSAGAVAIDERCQQSAIDEARDRGVVGARVHGSRPLAMDNPDGVATLLFSLGGRLVRLLEEVQHGLAG